MKTNIMDEAALTNVHGSLTVEAKTKIQQFVGNKHNDHAAFLYSIHMCTGIKGNKNIMIMRLFCTAYKWAHVLHKASIPKRRRTLAKVKPNAFGWGLSCGQCAS